MMSPVALLLQHNCPRADNAGNSIHGQHQAPYAGTASRKQHASSSYTTNYNNPLLKGNSSLLSNIGAEIASSVAAAAPKKSLATVKAEPQLQKELYSANYSTHMPGYTGHRR
jgi:hypothetical protein